MFEGLTYNIEYGRKLDEIFAWINGLPQTPSLLCFQEFPQDRIGDIPKLAKLPYGVRFAPSIKKNGGTWGELTAFDQRLFNLVRTEIVDLGDNDFERKVRGFSAWRTTLITDLESKAGDITVVNAHLTWFAWNSRRLQQLSMVLNHMGNPENALLVGDFNYPTGNDLDPNRLNKFMENNGGFKFAGPNTYTHIAWGIIRHRIDYVFAKGCRIGRVRVPRLGFSDHDPVLFQIDI